MELAYEGFLVTSKPSMILSGKEPAAAIRATLAAYIQAKQLSPCLAVLLVGEDPASQLYVRLKERAALEIGIKTRIHHTASISQNEALALIHAWNEDPAVHGILIQLPLPATLDTDTLIGSIDPRKDVDAFHPINREALLRGEGVMFSPVHLAVLTLIAQSSLVLNGANALLLAKSSVFAEPLAYLLGKTGAHVETHTIVPHASILKRADVLVSALGQAGCLRGELLKEHAVVIDISTNQTPTGVVGDVDVSNLLPSQEVSPVPGGVGPLTIAFLLRNVMESCGRMCAKPRTSQEDRDELNTHSHPQAPRKHPPHV